MQPLLILKASSNSKKLPIPHKAVRAKTVVVIDSISKSEKSKSQPTFTCHIIRKYQCNIRNDMLIIIVILMHTNSL